jgi:23S rRNA (cytosine1962-C5)-methyltransferase
MIASATVLLKAKEERRIHGGHPWVFSNEIQSMEGQPSSGDVVAVLNSHRGIVGYGFFSEHSLISVRIISNRAEESLKTLLTNRLHAALRRRIEIGYAGSFRMVFGESDGLPGLIIDKYETTFVIESFTAGIDRLIPLLVDILVSDFGATDIGERSESVWRLNEGLELISRPLFGNCEPQSVQIESIFYNINILRGLKTGFFLDQRENRRYIEKMSLNRSVLDCFCADGGFSMHARKAGARRVVGVDASDLAIQRARENALQNGFSDISFVDSDVFEYLKSVSCGEFDIIILDPPAFVKTKKKLRTGLKGYRKLNELALSKFGEFGILVTCSCSQHVTEDLFLAELLKASVASKKRLRVVSLTGAAKDHPVLLSMPETKYLKCVVAIVEDA